MKLPFSIPRLYSFKLELSVPTRCGELTTKYQKKLHKLPDQCPYHQIITALSVLKDRDYVVFTSTTDPYHFIQYCKKDKDLIFDFSIPTTVWGRRHLFWRAKYGLEKLGFSDKRKLFYGLSANQKYLIAWRDNTSGRLIQAHCDTDLNLATKVAMALLPEIYQLPQPFSVQVEFGSYRSNILSKTASRTTQAFRVIRDHAIPRLTRYYPFSLFLTRRTYHFRFARILPIFEKILLQVDDYISDLYLDEIEMDRDMAYLIISSSKRINSLRIKNILTKILNTVLDGQTQGFVIGTKKSHQLRIAFPVYYNGSQFVVGQE